MSGPCKDHHSKILTGIGLEAEFCCIAETKQYLSHLLNNREIKSCSQISQNEMHCEINCNPMIAD